MATVAAETVAASDETDRAVFPHQVCRAVQILAVQRRTEFLVREIVIDIPDDVHPTEVFDAVAAALARRDPASLPAFRREDTHEYIADWTPA